MIELETLEPAPVDPRANQEAVVTRDGVRLATDVYLPDAPGPWPTILVRLPYDKNGRYTFMPQLAPHVSRRGYAFVAQDVRGRFRSGGETRPFVHEPEDGYDTIEWIIQQEWSNGDVGMFGDSYYGFTQWAAVASRHPALRAIVPRVTCADLGGWLQAGVDPLYGGQYLAEVWTDNLMHTWPIDWAHRPLSEVFDPGMEAIGTRSRGLDDLLDQHRNGGALNPFPESHPFEVLNVPTLHVVGWFDNISRDSMRDYTALTTDPRTAHLQYLLADSTDHENYRLSDVPISDELNHDQNDAALERMIPGYLYPALDFFDVFLAKRNEAEALPRVRWHLSNGEWQESDAWPPPGSSKLRLFLGDASAATVGQGSLSLLRPETESTATWEHDPHNLVPSTVENPFAFLYEYPDESEVAERPDVALFVSEPLDQRLDLAGPGHAYVSINHDGPSAHIFVKVIDLAPDGRALMLLRGQVAIDTSDKGTLTEVYLGHTGYRMQPGDRIGMLVSSSDFPLYLAHPGTDESPWFATTTSPRQQQLSAGGLDPSHLRLTVLNG
jgi:predicted acyl esterase